MKYTTNTIEVTRGEIHRSERRIARQREIVAKAPAEGELGTQAQALLLIMEQSLLSMVRFLQMLEQVTDIDNRKGDRAVLRPPRPARRREKSAELPAALTEPGASTEQTGSAPATERDGPAASRRPPE
jgi:hypothetical protein